MRIELCLATEDLIAIRGRGFTTRSIDHQYAVAAVHARIVPVSQSRLLSRTAILLQDNALTEM